MLCVLPHTRSPYFRIYANTYKKSQLNRSYLEFYRAILKRGVDILLASMMLAAALPVMLLFALMVKIDSRGPILYSQVRVGRNRRRSSHLSHLWGRYDRRHAAGYGKPFEILKFRSMRTDAEAGKAIWCKKGDTRVTRIGKILRKTHLDEVPQLLNYEHLVHSHNNQMMRRCLRHITQAAAVEPATSNNPHNPDR